jgi:2-keto-4-pentenoate hydratase
MLDSPRVRRLATRLASARKAGTRLEALPADLVPLDAPEAEAVQALALADFGPARAYKVSQTGDGPGAFAAIPAAAMFSAPAASAVPQSGLKVELEVAFRLGRDLPGRPDGVPYAADEVADAVAGALIVFELVNSRLPPEPKPSPLVALADAMSNWGLILGGEIADWREHVTEDIAVALTVNGRPVVDRRGGHPSGHPLHPMTWLANALVARGAGLKAGDIVTTGAFGGAHPIAPGETAVGTIADFPTITFKALP